MRINLLRPKYQTSRHVEPHVKIYGAQLWVYWRTLLVYGSFRPTTASQSGRSRPFTDALRDVLLGDLPADNLLMICFELFRAKIFAYEWA